ncbi:MAG TPA: PorV/PorQ family protein, partial [Ignavibacteriales bacterium]|nr:PorV/PorQ family protein [Ignavibacteriales bacterium]
KYIQETIWNSSANGFAFDVGTYYVTPFNDLVIGASISNFGTKMQLDGRDIQINTDPNGDGNSGPNNIPSQYSMDSYDVPLTFRIGLAMDVIKTRFIVVKTAVDATHPNDNTEYVNSGIEFAFNRMFFLRAGYKSLFLEDSEQGLTLGAGLNYETASGLSVSFNYAYADYNRLKDVQYFDVSIAL